MPAEMDARDMEVFLSVAKHLNFTRAGKEVHLSQPSVSVRVRQLERDLGVKLFEQLGRRVTLTEAGRLLVPHASRVLAAMDDARHAVEELQGLERATIRIGASTTPGMYLVPKIIARFMRRHPKVEIHLGIEDTRRVEEGVAANEFDFGFVGGHLVGDQIDVIPWLTDEVMLVAPPGHALIRKRIVGPKDIAGEPFIFREQGSATQAAVERGLRASDLQVKAVMEMSNPEAVKQAVQGGLGLAFLSRFAVEAELKAGTLAAVRVRGLAVRRELKIVHRRDKHLSRAVRAFIQTAKR